MNKPPNTQDIISAETEHVNAILEKANALLRRRREDRQEIFQKQNTNLIDEDIPLLTDNALDSPTSPTSNPAPDAAQHHKATKIMPLRVAEHLIELDTLINRIVQNWLEKELPQHLEYALEKILDDLLEQTLAHAKATLIPALSEKIAQTLDSIDSERIQTKDNQN